MTETLVFRLQQRGVFEKLPPRAQDLVACIDEKRPQSSIQARWDALTYFSWMDTPDYDQIASALAIDPKEVEEIVHSIESNPDQESGQIIDEIPEEFDFYQYRTLTGSKKQKPETEERKERVLELKDQGYTNREIAGTLEISSDQVASILRS